MLLHSQLVEVTEKSSNRIFREKFCLYTQVKNFLTCNIFTQTMYIAYINTALNVTGLVVSDFGSQPRNTTTRVN